MSYFRPTHEISESLQFILDKLESERCPPSCLQCRERRPSNNGDGSAASSPSSSPAVKPLVRCSRCQVAHYCGAACQKKHFDFHKGSCKSIFKKRTRVEASHYFLDGPNVHCYVLFDMVQMADELVIMGYRESDTLENGRAHYQTALYWYFEICKISRNSFFKSPDHSVEDKVILLLILLGGNATHIIKDCFVSNGSHRIKNFGPPMIEAPEEFQTHGLASKDTPFQCLSLLVAMRSLAQYRRDNEAFLSFESLLKSITAAATTTRYAELEPLNFLLETLIRPYLLGDVGANGTRHMDRLPSEIQLLVRAIEYHGTKSYLVHLRDSIPLSPQLHAPDLFLTDPERRTIFWPLKHTPQEFWYLYQDAFFMTPGVNNILHEFVPEQDDDYLDDDER